MEKLELVPSDQTPRIHPACDAYPPMSPEEFAEHKADVRLRGQILPCEIYGEFLLDGRHRWRACLELGLTVKVQRFFGSEEDAIARVASLNGKRRNLTAGQKAAAAAALEPLFAATLKKQKVEKCADAAKEQPRETDGKLGHKPSRVDQIVEQPGVRPKPDRAAEMAAKATGANPSYVADIKKLNATHPDLADDVKAGKKTVPEAKREAKSREPDPEPDQRTERKSASRAQENPESGPNTLFGARVAWSAISRQKRQTFIVAYNRIPAAMRDAFWVWAQQKVEDGE